MNALLLALLVLPVRAAAAHKVEVRLVEERDEDKLVFTRTIPVEEGGRVNFVEKVADGADEARRDWIFNAGLSPADENGRHQLQFQFESSVQSPPATFQVQSTLLLPPGGGLVAARCGRKTLQIRVLGKSGAAVPEHFKLTAASGATKCFHLVSGAKQSNSVEGSGDRSRRTKIHTMLRPSADGKSWPLSYQAAIGGRQKAGQITLAPGESRSVGDGFTVGLETTRK